MLGHSCFVCRLRPFLAIGAVHQGSAAVYKYCSHRVHSQPFLGKPACQFPAPDPIYTCRFLHTKPLRPPPVEIHSVVGARDAARTLLITFHRSSRDGTSPVLGDYRHISAESHSSCTDHCRQIPPKSAVTPCCASESGRRFTTGYIVAMKSHKRMLQPHNDRT